MSAKTPVFLYGTLLNLDLLGIVLGHPPVVRSAALPNCRSAWVEGRDFPMIYRLDGATAQGIVLDASAEDIARMDHYEGPFSYDLAQVNVVCGGQRLSAQTYFPAPGLYQPGADWEIEIWTQTFWPKQMPIATKIMNQYVANG